MSNLSKVLTRRVEYLTSEIDWLLDLDRSIEQTAISAQSKKAMQLPILKEIYNRCNERERLYDRLHHYLHDVINIADPEQTNCPCPDCYYIHNR